jgi:hypothetical protein
VVDRFIEAPEREIEISYPDCGKSFRQWSDVLPRSELMQSLYTLFGSRRAALLGMGCGKQSDIQW